MFYWQVLPVASFLVMSELLKYYFIQHCIIQSLFAYRPNQQFQQSIMKNNNPNKNTPNSISRSLQMPTSIIKDIEKTINPQEHLPGHHNCPCQLCRPYRFPEIRAGQMNLFRNDNKKSLKLFKRMLEGLTNHIAKTLKLYLPDILFIEGEQVQIYQTHRRQGRIFKVPGSTLLKNIYPTFLRMRKQYKYSLEQKYNQQMLDKINPEFMHIKYYSKLLPSNFNQSNNSKTLELNKFNFRKYILHNDSKFQIAALEEHKLNDKEPFCIVRYKDGNCQLLNQHEFEIFALANPQKMQEEVAYFQSYIKYKLQSSSILFSEYDCSATLIDQQMDLKAQRQVMTIFGAIDKYSSDYKDIQTLDQLNIQLMLTDQTKYVNFMTYKIANYLAMVSNIYISHLKIKWILNDIGSIYLQEVMEIQISEFPTKILRFKLRQNDSNINFYKQNQFVDRYKEMKKRKVINTLIIKRQIDTKTYTELLNLIDPSTKEESKTVHTQNRTSNLHTLRKSHLHIDHSPFSSQEQDTPYHSLRNSKAPNRRQKGISRTLQMRQNVIEFSLSHAEKQISKKARYKDFISYEQHLKKHPQIVMKHRRFDSNNLNRYSLVPDKINRVDHNINNHFRFNMSTQDRKKINKPEKSPEGNEQLKQYLSKKQEKAANSLLYTTFFHQLNNRRASLYQTLDYQNASQNISH